MAKHSKIGINGEQIAANFLQNKGYQILLRNWRYGKKEVDIVATRGEMAILTEVKTRSSTILTFPEEAVTPRKQQHLRAAAEGFMEIYPEYKHVRFDIVSILMEAGHAKQIIHFEEAFH
jgi:putative endonuclease